MRIILLSLTMAVALMLSAACNSSEQANTSAGNASAAQPANARTTTTTTAQPATDGPPVATSHAAPPAPSNAGGPAAGGASGPDTSALDAKIEQAEARAKAAGAGSADKQAAAAAYLARANVFYAAQNPSLYKFALRDFRRTLKYDPSNAVARDRKQQIEEIYKSMGRPIPELGNEP
ncbi:MAG TPA: hypothetical protein VGC87_05275 [Pyrinomonadaceae bacterium]|jgi:hypothetical protein